MRMMLVVAALVAGCGGGAVEVEGPFTGAARRFFVSSVALPMQRSDFGADLNGDGRPDNQFGNLAGEIGIAMGTQEHGDEIVAADSTPMVLEIVSDDPALLDDATVGVRFLGAEGAPGDQVGASLHSGVLRSNRVSLRHAEAATVRVPLFADADMSAVWLDRYQIDLTANGTGGFVGRINGTIPPADVVADLFPAFDQMLRNHPRSTFIHLFDLDRDGKITVDELRQSRLIQSLTAPDVEVGVPANTNKDRFSFGVSLTLVPCADEACTHARPAPSCFDRVRNGDERDVDCGGSCGPCSGGAACVHDADCAPLACDGGTCRAPSCFDGLRNGFEVDIDCGPGCAPCQEGAHCYDDRDCQSGACGRTVVLGPLVCVPKAQ